MSAIETVEIEGEALQRIFREKISQFEDAMRQFPGAKFGDLEECPLKHTFADGIYVREIFIPAGMLIVGKLHKHSHPNFLLEGEVSVVTESRGVERLKAPLSMISAAGTKRIVFTHTDCRWVTVHTNQNNTRDVAALEDEIIAKSYGELNTAHHRELEDA